MAILVTNKRAHFDYAIGDTYEAGIVLCGSEVKSLKSKEGSLKESFVTLKDQELYLTNAYISPYKFSGDLKNYEPTRPRKLLLKRSEIKILIGKMKSEGLTLVPIKLYTRRKLVKLEFGIGRGKKKFDKRQDISKKDAKRKIDKMLKHF